MARPVGGWRLSLQCGDDGFGRLYNACLPAKQAIEPSYLGGFASPARRAYLTVVTAMGRMS